MYGHNKKVWKHNTGTDLSLHNEIGRLLLNCEKFYDSITDFAFTWIRCEIIGCAQGKTEGDVKKCDLRYSAHCRYSLSCYMYGIEYAINDAINFFPFLIPQIVQRCGEAYIDKYGIKSVLYINGPPPQQPSRAVANKLTKKKFNSNITTNLATLQVDDALSDGDQDQSDPKERRQLHEIRQTQGEPESTDTLSINLDESDDSSGNSDTDTDSNDSSGSYGDDSRDVSNSNDVVSSESSDLPEYLNDNLSSDSNGIEAVQSSSLGGKQEISD